MVLNDVGQTAVAYIRVACLAVGAYEYLTTLPMEYAIYKSQYRVRRISRQCILFILIRYVSIVAITMNGVGFFGHFSSAECSHLYHVPPLLKVLQALSSQLVLFHRTYTISQRSTRVGAVLSLMVLASVPGLLFANIFKRQHVMTPEHNCTSGNDDTARIAWIHYIICMVFDVVTTAIASTYLWRYTREFKRLRVYLRRLIYEGLGYFVLLTAVNILNVVIYLSENTNNQSSAVTIGYIATWIMSQRILTRQQGASTVSLEEDNISSFNITIAHSDPETKAMDTQPLAFLNSPNASTISIRTATTKTNCDDLWMRLPLTGERPREPIQVHIRKRSETVA